MLRPDDQVGTELRMLRRDFPEWVIEFAERASLNVRGETRTGWYSAERHKRVGVADLVVIESIVPEDLRAAIVAIDQVLSERTGPRSTRQFSGATKVFFEVLDA